jgi:hypothetical protein
METLSNKDAFAIDGNYRGACAKDWGNGIVTQSNPTIHNWTVGDER